VTIDKVKENVDFMVIAKGKGRSDPNIYLSAEKDACNKKNALAICNHFGIGKNNIFYEKIFVLSHKARLKKTNPFI
jgi:hypothetical protein